MKNKLLLVSVVVAILAMTLTLGSCDDGGPTVVRQEKLGAPTGFTVTADNTNSRYNISFNAVSYPASYQFVYRIVNSGISGNVSFDQVTPASNINTIQYRYTYAQRDSMFNSLTAGTYQVRIGVVANSLVDDYASSDVAWAAPITITVP